MYVVVSGNLYLLWKHLNFFLVVGTFSISKIIGVSCDHVIAKKASYLEHCTSESTYQAAIGYISFNRQYDQLCRDRTHALFVL